MTNWPQWKLNLVRDFKDGFWITSLIDKYVEGLCEEGVPSDNLFKGVEQIIRDYMNEFPEGRKAE